ncbi:MAG: RNA polymerase sigma factor [Planctomycetaceae bacterium]
MNSTSLSLLERIRGDDEVAWETFVDLYSPLVFYWCRRSASVSAEDAADIMQDVFRAVAGAVDRFERSKAGQFRSWLRVVTQNKIRDFHRQHDRVPRPAGGTVTQRQLAEVPDPASDEESLSNEKALLTRRALELMKSDFEEKTWRAFWMSAVEGDTAREISEKLGISPQAVWQSCYRVRKRLREELADLL